MILCIRVRFTTSFYVTEQSLRNEIRFPKILWFHYRSTHVYNFVRDPERPESLMDQEYMTDGDDTFNYSVSEKSLTVRTLEVEVNETIFFLDLNFPCLRPN